MKTRLLFLMLLALTGCDPTYVGWERTEVWRFGPDPGRHALLLLRRV
mgnify:CR=1 FL=1